LFYSKIADALTEEGVFFDKVLTYTDKKRELDHLEMKYRGLPINLLYVNSFSCEFLFCSELLNLRHVVDTRLFYDILQSRFNGVARLMRFLELSPLITPNDCLWFYGRNWKDINIYYFTHLARIEVFPEERKSPYFPNLRLVVSRKKPKHA
jgi:hypothetical protein